MRETTLAGGLESMTPIQRSALFLDLLDKVERVLVDAAFLHQRVRESMKDD
jgi:hypothetical protein